MIIFYDRAGKPITLERYSELHADIDYKIVQQDYIGDLWLSTVWLGIDHGFGGTDAPLIFETMLFDQDGEALHCERWPTEVVALAAHDQLLADARAKAGKID